MNQSQLQYVKAVAETGSFTLAAERCHVTQPALSNGIAQLEQEFEERLFTRTTRMVALTPFGEHILPLINKVLTAQEDLLREAETYAHPSRQVVRIGTSPLLRGGWLAAMLESFRKEHPDTEVILREQNMSELQKMLENDLLDFVFGVAESHKPSRSGTFLYREPLFFIPCGENRPKGGNGIKFADISEDTFVMVPPGCGLARATRALFKSHRRRLNEYPGEALSYQALEEWTSLGLGSAILPKSKLQPQGRKACLLKDNDGRELTLDFEAVWSNTQVHHSHVREFAEFLKRYKEKPEGSTEARQT